MSRPLRITEKRRNIFSKIIAVFALISNILFPISPIVSAQTFSAQTSTQAVITEEPAIKDQPILLSDITDIPKVIIGTSTVADISRIDWDQLVDINGNKVPLYSDAALATISGISDNIKQFVKYYQADIAAIDNSTTTSLTDITAKKLRIKQALQHLIAKELIKEGVLPDNYFTLQSRGQIEDFSHIINLSEATTTLLDTKNAIGKSVLNIGDVNVSSKNIKTKSKFFDTESFGGGMMMLSMMESSSSESGIDYLTENQNADGSWGTSTKKFITTVAVLDALYSYEQTTSTAYEDGISWIEYYISNNNDYLAEKIRVLNRASVTTTAEVIAYSINENDGGFVFNRGYQSDVMTSAHALESLNEAGYTDPGENPNLTVVMGLYYLTQTQNFDSRWSAFSGGASSIPVSVDVINALLPYRTSVLSGFESGDIEIADYVDSGISALKNMQNSDGSWGDNLLNTALSFYIIKTSNSYPIFEEEAVDYLQGAQAEDGSFANGDLYITAKVMEALSAVSIGGSIGNLSVTDIATTTALYTNSSTTLQISIENNGDAAVSDGTLEIMADDYNIAAIDFVSNDIVIDASSTVQVSVEITNTSGFVGNVDFTAYIKGSGDISYLNSRFDKTLTFNSDPSGLPGLPVYFIAHKYTYIDGSSYPAFNVRWAQKTDPNRLNYVFMWRLHGASEWNQTYINNSWNGTFAWPFTEDQHYDVTVGALALDGTRIIYYTDSVDVVTSADSQKYATSTISGTMAIAGRPLLDTNIEGYALDGSSDNEGDYTVENVPYGANAMQVDDFRYENYWFKFVDSGNNISDFNIETLPKLDIENPTVTYLHPVGYLYNYQTSNKVSVPFSFDINDDVGIQSAKYEYYEPSDSQWHLIGTENISIAGSTWGDTWAYSWYIPGNLSGTGYQFRVTVRDFSGKDSTSTSYGPFEITEGNAIPQFNFIAPSISSPLQADSSYTIKWSASDDDNARIDLYYSDSSNATITTAYVNDFLKQYEWDTSEMPAGIYYLHARVNDGYNQTLIVDAVQPITIFHSQSNTIFIDNFNNYSNGDLPGQGSWVNQQGGNNFNVQTSVVFEGEKAIYSIRPSGTYAVIYKDGNSINDGRVTVYLYPTNTNIEYYYQLYEGTTYHTQIKLESGNAYGHSDVLLGSFNVNQWNPVEIEWRSSDHSVHSRINEGIWSGWASTTWSSGLDRIRIVTYSNNGVYMDYIAVNPYSTSSNPAPTSPTNLFVESQTNPVGVTSTSPKFSAIYNDPNAGDSANKYHIQVSTSSSFNSIYWDSGTSTMATTSVNTRSPDIIYAGSWLTASTTFYWRILFVDIEGNMGAWSTEEATLVRANLAPGSPTDLLTEGQTNPVGVTTTAPKFSAIYNDIDPGDSANKYVIQVSTSSSFSPIYWDSGTSTMATTTEGDRSSDISYAGSALIASTTYYWRIKFIDIENAEGAWSATTATFSIISSSAIFTDNFNSYSNGDLPGQGSWVSQSNGGYFDIWDTAVFEGVKSVYSIRPGGTYAVVYKDGDFINDGRMVGYFYPTNNDVEFYFQLYEGGTFITQVKLESGNIYGQGDALISSFNTNQWNSIEIEWRSSDGYVRSRANSGSWLSWSDASNNWSSGISRVRLVTYSNNAVYMDYIAGNLY